MPSHSIFSLLKELIEDCQKFRDTDDRGCDGPGSQECLACEFITETAGDIIDEVLDAMANVDVRSAIRAVL